MTTCYFLKFWHILWFQEWEKICIIMNKYIVSFENVVKEHLADFTPTTITELLGGEPSRGGFI